MAEQPDIVDEVQDPPVSEEMPDDAGFLEDTVEKPDDDAPARREPDNPYDFDDSAHDIPLKPAPKGKPEEKEPEPEDEDLTPPAVSDDLRTEASELGMTPAMIDAIPPADLEAFVSRYRKDDADSVDDDSDPADETSDVFDLNQIEGVDPDLLDPEMVQVIQKLNEHHDARYEAQRQRLDMLMDVFERQAMGQAVERFDQQVTGLGKSWSKIFGDGATQAVDKDARSNRDKLWDAMERQASGYQSRKESVPSESQLFNEALRVVFGDQIETMTRSKVRDSVRQRERRQMHRPTDREGSEPSGTQKAIAAVAEFMAERNELDPEFESYMNGT